MNRQRKRINEVKEAVRQPYTFPGAGAYPKAFIAHDGCICSNCIRHNLRGVFNDIKTNAGPWNVLVDVVWEGEHYCVVCNKPIETAYGPEPYIEE